MNISVVIPTTSRTDSLNIAIESVLTQDVDCPVEILIVYNNVKPEVDLTTPLNQQFAPASHQSIRELVISDTNANANTARNFGTQNASGEVVAYLDSDDIWYPNHLSERIDLLNDTSVNAVFGPFVINRTTRKIHRALTEFKIDFSAYEFIWKHRGLAQTSGFLVRKSFAVQSPWDEALKRSQDHDFFVRMNDLTRWAQVKIATYEVVWGTFDHRSYDFESYWKFYDDNRSNFDDKTACGYLFTRLIEASFSNDKYFDLFRDEIRRRGNRLSLPKKIISVSKLGARIGWYINQSLN